MYKDSYQKGFLTILYGGGAKPLSTWKEKVQNGYIRRVIDEDVKALVLEVMGANVETNYITCPADPKITLGIGLPFLVMIVKNMKKYFSFEIQIRDDRNMARRFRASNYQSATRIREFSTSMPISLKGDWTRIQLNIADFTKRAYGTTFVEALRMTVHANIRIRRIYFADRLYAEEELPDDYKIYPNLKSPLKKKSMLAAIGKKTKDKTQKKDVPQGAPPTPIETRSKTDVNESARTDTNASV